MTLDNVVGRVKAIEASSADYEIAHSLEDDLMREFIAHVQRVGDPLLSAMAEKILAVGDIDFPRYCA